MHCLSFKMKNTFQDICIQLLAVCIHSATLLEAQHFFQSTQITETPHSLRWQRTVGLLTHSEHVSSCYFMGLHEVKSGINELFSIFFTWTSLDKKLYKLWKQPVLTALIKAWLYWPTFIFISKRVKNLYCKKQPQQDYPVKVQTAFSKASSC